MRRFASLTLGIALACGTSATRDPGPLDTFYKPTGLAVHRGKLLVASSNFDLRYGLEDGGTLISVDPAPPATLVKGGGVRLASYSGELAVADKTACGLTGESVAVVATRSNTALYAVGISDVDGSLHCDGCEVPLASGNYADPLAVGVACADGWGARAYVAYLRSFDGRGWFSEYDLKNGGLRSAEIPGSGPIRGFAFDAERRRLWTTGLVLGGASSLSFVDLADASCHIDVAAAAGGCTVGAIRPDQLPTGLELRSIALSSAASNPPGVRRAYLTGRYYDVASAVAAGGRTTDYGGQLLVLDLVENGIGGVDARIVYEFEAVRGLGTAAADILVLPRGTGWPQGRRDVVAALDGAALTLYDDETGEVRTFGVDTSADKATGAPVLGHMPWGIAADPPLAADNVAHLYVGSFEESFVTEIYVPLDHIASASKKRTISGGAP